MKKAFLILISILAISCGKESKKAENEGPLKTLEGEFIFLTDAAVLKSRTALYGVKLDDKMYELANMIKPLQRDTFDMVPITIKATVAAKEAGKEGWDSIVTIKEIIQVKAPRGERPLRIEAGDQLKTEGSSIKVESETTSQN